MDTQATDAQIAAAAINAIGWYRAAGTDSITVAVAGGYVTLTGIVHDIHQRGAAERAVRTLRGVRGVSNALVVDPSQTGSP